MLKSIIVAVCLALPIVSAFDTTWNCNGTRSTYEWVPSKSKQPIPDNAVYGGYDKYQNTIYVGRALHNGVYWPANVNAIGVTSITVDGKVLWKENFDILTGNNFSWQMGFNGVLPNNAMLTQPNLAIARAATCDALKLGKVSRNGGICYFEYEGVERQSKRYEVLVHNEYTCDCRF